VERELHGIAAEAGLAPRIRYADPRDRWLITDFIEGSAWTDAHFGRADSLARLGDTLLTLHALPTPAAGRFDLLEALRGYARRLEQVPQSGQAAPAFYVKEAVEAWQLCGAPEREVAILHHDLHGSNLVEGRSGLVLLDWECAVVNDPLLDVACVLSYFDTARPHVHVLLEHAGLESVTERQLAASVWLFDLHSWFWYRERRLRLTPTQAEINAERRLATAVDKGIPWSL
jgi:aminoglycoside phosphotransferase (APT) family kinase protein